MVNTEQEIQYLKEQLKQASAKLIKMNAKLKEADNMIRGLLLGHYRNCKCNYCYRLKKLRE
jgi:hypothetical protein